MKERYLRLVRKSYRLLRHKRLRHRPWWQYITKPLFDRQLWKPCRDTVASGLAIGFFFSMIIILPMQMIFAAILAMRFRVNVPFALLGCWVSNLFTNVPIGLIQVKMGDWMVKVLHIPMPQVMGKLPFHVPDAVGNFILGMIVSALLLGLIAYPIVHIFSMIMPHHLPVLKRRKIAPQQKG